jgi:tetratricopeptide (TPR) repeat protein
MKPTMMRFRKLCGTLAGLAMGLTALAQEPSNQADPPAKPRMAERSAFTDKLLELISRQSNPPAKSASPAQPKPAEKMPITGLAPAKHFPNNCLLKYRVTTSSPHCQAFFDQGLGYFYSYVWMEAARSFETATVHDPNCALAWWGLSRALERWGRGKANDMAQKAHDLREHASHREQQLIITRMQEKGLLPGVGDQERRRQAAIATLDKMLAMYDDDEEAWYYRAQLSGGAGLFGGSESSVPFYKALLRINPLHPGATHELVHFYEKFQRPALGWKYSEDYIKSSPGIPHPWHMQAHLATRLGRWDKASSSSLKAAENQRAYHREQGVSPSEDWQFSHHLEILTLSLIHDGRYREARQIKKECWDLGYRHWEAWFRLALGERDWDEALKIAEQFRKSDKQKASYFAALVFLSQGDSCRATAEVEVLLEAQKQRRNDRTLELRMCEVQGLLLCQSGAGEAGLKMIARCVEKTKDDYGHHAWGNGAYYMEVWGLAALLAGKPETAEEAFLEALAHDSGSLKAALGLQVLCEQLGRSDEARQYADLARRYWKHAEVRSFDAELAAIRKGCTVQSVSAKLKSETAAGSNGP